MKTLIIIFTILLLNSCKSQTKKSSFLPKEYSFPLEQIHNGKTLVYSKVGSIEPISFNDIILLNNSGAKYIISKRYSLTTNFDSTKISTDGKIQEVYSYMFNTSSVKSPTKSRIITDTIIDNGTKFGQQISKIEFPSNDNTATIETKQEYLKDTLITWKNQQINCIVIQSQSTMEFKSNSNPSLKSDMRVKGTLYFAKDIGLIRYNSITKTMFEEFELIEIKDKENK